MKRPNPVILLLCLLCAIGAANLYFTLTQRTRTAAAPPPSSPVYSLPPIPEESSSQGASGPKPDLSSPKPPSVPAQEDSGLTLFPCGSIQVAIPDEYTPYLEVECAERGISVWEKASLEQSQADTGYPGGFLFNIAAISAGELPEFIQMDRPGSYLFAQGDGWYYTYTGATDVQLYRSQGVTDADQALWDQLYRFSNEVAEETRLRNGLSLYFNPSAPSAPGSQIPDDLFQYQEPERTLCPTCKGGLLCPQCGGMASCTRCGGLGTTTCTSCIGLGHCTFCGGGGYTYAGVGMAFRQERCSKCRGSGDCSTCQNTGRMTCTACYGSPNCFFCQGLGMCPGCNGTGYLPW